MVRLLEVVQHLPLPAKRSIARVATSERVIPTAILSNLGRLDEDLDFGCELRACEVWFSPPTKMPMGLAIGAVTAGGRLHLVFRYRPLLFGPGDVAAFADCYLIALDQVAAHAYVARRRSTSQRCGGLRASFPDWRMSDRPQAPDRSPHYPPVIR